MEIPSDAPEFILIEEKTVRVTSLHSGNTFSAIFLFRDDSFYKFKVRLDSVVSSTKDDLFKCITGSQSKFDNNDYFQIHPTFLDIRCIGMDSSGCVIAEFVI